jgi:hypothetical protein
MAACRVSFELGLLFCVGHDEFWGERGSNRKVIVIALGRKEDGVRCPRIKKRQMGTV